MEKNENEVMHQQSEEMYESTKKDYHPVKKYRILKEIFSWAKVIILALIIAFVCSNYIALPIQVEGNSMYPTLEDGEFGLSYVFKRRFMEVERGDIVVVKYRPTNEFWVKRVIALPNETISCKNDKIYINGKILEEPYLNKEYVKKMKERQGYFTEDFQEVKLKDNEYFLMGDNRQASFDSRRVEKMFTLDDIQSANGFVLFPFDKMKSMN